MTELNSKKQSKKIDPTAHWEEHWRDFAEAFIHPLSANGVLNKFVTNPAVTGAYAETWIRSMVRSMLPQFRVSTGAVIKSSDRLLEDKRKIPQRDLIVWDPSELPALFEQGDFALVSNIAVKAIIEIKRTCTDINKLNEQLYKYENLLKTGYHNNILGVVLFHPKPLFPENSTAPDWLEKIDELFPFGEKAKTRLFDDKSQKPDSDGIFAFIYFLAQVAKQNKYTKSHPYL